MIRLRFCFFFILLFIGFGARAQINFDSSASFVYLKGKDAASLPANWMTENYNPVGWLSGKMPFKYVGGTGGTFLSDMRNSYSTVYMRSTFTVSKVESLGDVNFSVNYTDGFIIWINGEIAIQQNQPDSATYNSLSNGLHGSGVFIPFTLPAHDLDLKEGENVIAIQGFNSSLTSTHFYFDMKMTAEVRPLMTGDSIKVVFSQPDGFYDQPFDLTLSVPDDSYDLVYTIDGSNPQKTTTAIMGGKKATIRIDPTIASDRPATPAYIVRASLIKGDLNPSFPLTQTYIFLDQVINQTNPGGGWPTVATINGQKIDLAMDSDVIKDPIYSGQIKASLKSIPSISVVTDLEDLFNSATGIYVNATSHGDGWERFSSVELIDPNGKPGFAINAGLRIRGGYSRNDNFPKHAFRLFFRQEYDAPKLKFPLFEDEGTDEFDKVDLRCEQNYSWAHPSDNKARNTFVREVFSRDSQKDLGQPYTRSRYYHLYLNGMYWGLYMTQERAEANFASDYFGGSNEDYDVIKVNVSNGSYSIEATDGNTSSWQKLYNLCAKGFADNADYFALEGKDENGHPKKGGEVMVNIDNLIDYMQVIFYTGNFDAPVSAFVGSNSGPNNFYAIDRRDDRSSGFQFFAHDSEHSLMYTKEGPGIGLQENRVTIPNMQASSYSKFQPQWLHYKLTFNKEYRQRFADHVYRNFYNNGVFTPEANHDRFQKRVAQVAPAVVSESARWGDAVKTVPYTYADWNTEINNIYTQYFPVRTNIVLTQLRNAGLFPAFTPPIITKGDSRLNPGIYEATDNYQISLWNSNGQIYYTTDGSDPRLVGDQINPSAIAINSGGTLNLHGTAVVNTRIKDGERWSALATVKFLNPNEDYSNLKVTELNYHPTDSTTATEIVSGKSFEFIEFKNIGDKPINLTGLNFTSSIDYHFKVNDVLDPKQFYVIASKPKWFYERHFMVPTGNFSSNFSNSGEKVTLSDAKGNPVIDFLYLDINPWATDPDGGGASLSAAAKFPTGSPVDPNYWMSSSVYDGTPFADDPGIFDTIVDPDLARNAIVVYPNPTRGMLQVKVDGTFSDIQVEVFNLSGSMIYKSTMVPDGAINLKRLNIYPGIYLVNVKCNQKTSVHKIIYKP